ncbi:hypothetical protein GPK34_06000 [Secundilactobacillus kimchicus]|uniref:hypothetical protein n=1 Tax=Secundilactobacillus kimchicus TaxID=528209 RepID=UPI001C00E77C|nr:hypothetical protein [Secundilactobacillus kimchicus]MBT9671578.1 hypothetical protein [Secundilactobacillus kimchicus]
MKFNQTQIEKIAISEITKKMTLLDVEAEVNQNDKTPVTDGDLFLYDSLSGDTFKKSDIKGKVAIQVKGTTSQSFFEKERFNLGIDTLKAMRAIGGVLLFVVYIDQNGDSLGIYYRELSQIFIDMTIKNMHDKKSKAIKVLAFPDEREEARSRLFRASKELADAGMELRMNINSRPKQFIIKSYNNENIQTALENTDVVLYGLIDGIQVPWEILSPGKISVAEIRKINVRFSSSGKRYNSALHVYKTCWELHTGEERKIVLSFFVEDNEEKIKMFLETASTLDRQLENVKILELLLRNKTMIIDDVERNFNFDTNQDTELSDYELGLIQLRKRLEDFQYLEMMTHISFYGSDFSNEEIRELKSIYKIFKHPELVSKPGMYEGQVGGKSYFLILMHNLKSNNLMIRSVYKDGSEEILHTELDIGVKKKKTIEVNPYAYAGSEDLDFDQIGDFDPDMGVEWYRKNGFEDDVGIKLANDFTFKLLDSYDRIQNIKYLNAAVEVDEMLLDWEPENENLFLNYVQAIFRKNRKLGIKIKKKLLYLSESDDPDLQFGAMILLEAPNDELWNGWQKISNKQGFASFPIFKLIEEPLRKKMIESI